MNDAREWKRYKAKRFKMLGIRRAERKLDLGPKVSSRERSKNKNESAPHFDDGRGSHSFSADANPRQHNPTAEAIQ